MTSQEWKLITDTALQVLSSAEGLVESIRQREWAALLLYKGDLIGLATMDIWPSTLQGVKAVGLYSGNTWVRADFRGQNLTQHLALKFLVMSKWRYPRHRCYWIFGSSNYLSYLVMAKNFRTFWPRYDQETPPWELAYQRLAAERFYQHAWTTNPYGIIPNDNDRSFPSSDTEIPSHLLDDPHIQFYQRINPDHHQGAKLICSTPLDAINLFYFIRHTLERTKRRLLHRHSPNPPNAAPKSGSYNASS